MKRRDADDGLTCRYLKCPWADRKITGDELRAVVRTGAGPMHGKCYLANKTVTETLYQTAIAEGRHPRPSQVFTSTSNQGAQP